MPTEATTTYTVYCDNPGCGGVISWVQEKVAKDGNSLDEAFYRLIRVVTWDSEKQEFVERVFDTRACALAWFEHHYVPGCSPKEYVKRTTASREAEGGVIEFKRPENGQVDASPSEVES